MSMSHIFILIIIAVIVVPPDKLPDFARQIARFINDLRRSTTGVWDDIKKDAMVKPEDLLKHQDAPVPAFKHANENTNQSANQTADQTADQSAETAETKVETKKHES